jgi:hypothetical protein
MHDWITITLTLAGLYGMLIVAVRLIYEMGRPKL